MIKFFTVLDIQKGLRYSYIRFIDFHVHTLISNMRVVHIMQCLSDDKSNFVIRYSKPNRNINHILKRHK